MTDRTGPSEVLTTIGWGDDQDTLEMWQGGTLVSTCRHALKTTDAEVAAWIAESHVHHEAAAAGYEPADVTESIRRVARLLSAAADRLEEDWA